MRSAAVFAALVVLAPFLAACNQDEVPPTNQAKIAANTPDEESWNTTIVIADSMWTRSRIQVGRARRYYARAETLLDSGVYVEFFDRNGAITATLVADSARIDDRTNDMMAFGDVHAESNGGQQVVDTDKILYDNKRQEIRSDARVHVVDHVKQSDVRGVGFRSDLSLTDYTIYNPTGTFRAPQ